MHPLVHLLDHDDHHDNCDHDDLDENLNQDDQDDHDTQPRVTKSMIDDYHDHILFTECIYIMVVISVGIGKEKNLTLLLLVFGLSMS